MSEIQVVSMAGNIVARGKNLRVIGDYARKTSGWPSAPAVLSVAGFDASNKTLHVLFADGATCTTRFASSAVLENWCYARVKNGRGRYILPGEKHRYSYPK